MTTSSPTTSPTTSGHVTIVFTPDWGVSIGVGHAGRAHSTIERCGDDPVIRGTVITRILRKQAILVVKAPNGQKDREWTNFTLWLFGQDPNSKLGLIPHLRYVLFSDATPASSVPIHNTIPLLIDSKTGMAHDQFLCFTERVVTGILTGTLTLIDETGASPSDRTTIDAAHLLLGAVGLMVQGIGLGRSRGDDKCTMAISGKGYTKTDLQDERTTDALTRILTNQDNDDSPTYLSADAKAFADCLWSRVRESLREIPALPKDPPKSSPQDIAMSGLQQSGSGNTTWYETSLSIVLESPVVSYEVFFSSEVWSLDSLRGTVLVPWLHELLHRNYPGNVLVNSAIVSDDLRVSDALLVHGETPGLPVPFVLENKKVPEDKQDNKQPRTLFNRHIPIND